MIFSTFRRVLTASCFAFPAVIIAMQSAHAEDLQFTLHNNSTDALTEFYVESMGTKSWGENILTSPIEPGESATVTIADGKTTCKYGIKGTFKNGADVEHEDLNLCEMGSYTYTDAK